MTRIMKERWDTNKDKLRDALAERTDLNHKKKATEDQLDGFMDICRELICNAIKPYNFGWREDENWLPAEV